MTPENIFGTVADFGTQLDQKDRTTAITVKCRHPSSRRQSNSTSSAPFDSWTVNLLERQPLCIDAPSVSMYFRLSAAVYGVFTLTRDNSLSPHNTFSDQ